MLNVNMAVVEAKLRLKLVLIGLTAVVLLLSGLSWKSFAFFALWIVFDGVWWILVNGLFDLLLLEYEENLKKSQKSSNRIR